MIWPHCCYYYDYIKRMTALHYFGDMYGNYYYYMGRVGDTTLLYRGDDTSDDSYTPPPKKISPNNSAQHTASGRSRTVDCTWRFRFTLTCMLCPQLLHEGGVVGQDVGMDDAAPQTDALGRQQQPPQQRTQPHRATVRAPRGGRQSRVGVGVCCSSGFGGNYCSTTGGQ